MRIVHLPFYDDNPYQTLLMAGQRKLGHEVWEGGGGGNFLGVALREWKADLYHFHWLHPYLLRPSRAASARRATRFLAEVALLKLQGTSIAWTVHNLVNHDGLHPAIERNFSRAFAKFSDACFVHSNAAADAAAKQFWIPKSKLHVISHGNFIELYPNQIGRAEARHQLRLATEAKVFLFLGRIELYKGISDLIEAFRGMPDDCHLVLAGKVANLKLLPELERLAAGNPRIHLHPRRIPDDELQVFFNAADSVVLPFRQILTSGSLILAMGYGKVLVVPRIASLQEIVPSGGAVWFDPLDPTSLATALQEAAAAQPSAGGERNHHAALQWDWKKIASEIVRRASREGE